MGIHIHLYKAHGIADRQVSDAIIEIHDEVPSIDTQPGWEQRYRDFYDGQAQRLIDTLTAVLPGGTLDRVVAFMMLKAASLHKIQWPQEEKP